MAGAVTGNAHSPAENAGCRERVRGQHNSEGGLRDKRGARLWRALNINSEIFKLIRRDSGEPVSLNQQGSDMFSGL